MKSFAAVAAVALLANSATAATCDSSVLTSLLTDQYIQQCSTDSGYVFTAASIPTQDIIDKMCASSACLGLLADAKKMGLTECTLPVGDHINLLADLIDYVPPRCPSASGSAATTTAAVGSGATETTVGSTAGTGSSTATVTVPSTSTTSSATGSTAASAASPASAASASASGSSAASIANTVGAASLAVAVIGAYFL